MTMKHDAHGTRGEHHDEATLLNSHPHQQSTQHDVFEAEKADQSSGTKGWNTGTHTVSSPLPVGQMRHIKHSRRDKAPEHHPSSPFEY